MSDDPEGRLFGPKRAGTMLFLGAASLIVGIGLAMADSTPLGFWVRDQLASMNASSSDFIGRLPPYVIGGGAIVMTLWLLARLFSGKK